MILGPLAKSPPQLLSDCCTNNPVSVERVQHFKLLTITLSHDMNWQAHIDAIITKASSRLILSQKSLNPIPRLYPQPAINAIHFLYTPRSIKLPVKHTLTLLPSYPYLKIHFKL